MKSIKALAVTFISLFVVLFLAWFYMRIKGSTVAHPNFDNPFFSANSFKDEKRQLIAFRGESQSYPENSLVAFQAAAELSPKIILWMDVLMTRDHVLVASAEQALDQTPGNWIALKNWDEVQTHGFARVQEILQKIPQHRFILNLCDDVPGIDEALIGLLDYHDAGSRFLVQSERDRILKDARKHAPMLLFGSSAPQVTQLLMLSQMRLEIAASLNSDVLVVENSVDSHSRAPHVILNDAMISEAHRRGLKVFAGSPKTLPEAQDLITRGVDGVVTPNPSALKTIIE